MGTKAGAGGLVSSLVVVGAGRWCESANGHRNCTQIAWFNIGNSPRILLDSAVVGFATFKFEQQVFEVAVIKLVRA